MTTTTSESPAPRPEPADGVHPSPTRRRRRRWAIGGALLVGIAAAAVVLVVADPFATSSSHAAGVTDNGTPTSLRTVERGPLSQQVTGSGTLGYVAQPDGSPYEVVAQASGSKAPGAFTQLPSSGQVVHCGNTLYRVANNPVLLLCGSTPAYRSLSEGDSGPDVKELNANLVHLGYATRSQLDPSSDYFSSETAYALERLQSKRGEDETGSLHLGQAVFLPGPLRVSKTTATLGATARPGMPVAQATSTRRQVQLQLDASEQSNLSVGDTAQITLPDNRTTPGIVTRIGTVASASGSGSSGSSDTTIPVYLTLKHQKAAGSLDQAPVQVQVTTAGAKHALSVPVNALLARSNGGYAVETVDARGVHHLVSVTLGLFDDADGLVQVTGGSLQAGDRVVVPST